MGNLKKRGKKSSFIDPAVNQRKITNFFQKLGSSTPISPLSKDKSLVQSKLPFSNATKQRRSTNLKRKTCNDLTSKSTKKGLRVITDSLGNDVIVVSDSDDDTNAKRSSATITNNTRFNSASATDELQPGPCTKVPIKTTSMDAKGDVQRGKSCNNIEDDLVKPRTSKIVKRALFFSDENTEKIDGLELDSSADDDVHTTDNLNILPANSSTLNSSSETFTPPLALPSASATRTNSSCESYNEEDISRSYSPSLLENYKPSPNLFENEPGKSPSILDEFENCTLQRTRSFILTSPSEMFSPSPARKSPSKSPKGKAVFFSPVRHLNKCTSPMKSTSQSPSSNTKSITYAEITYNKSPNKNFKTSSQKDPYYLENFTNILNSVVYDDFNKHLFSQDDWQYIEAFDALSKPAKCLYVRLFNRKWRWKQAADVKYPEISDDLLPTFVELHKNNFLDEIKGVDIELDDVLDILSSEQMAMIGKKMNVNSVAKTKEKIKTALLKMAKHQRTLQGSSSKVLQKCALDLLGPTYKVSKNSRNLFARICIVYSPPQYWEDEGSVMSNQGLTALLTQVGKMDYPEYKISKTTKIYNSKEDLVRFHDAWCLHSEVQCYLQFKQWKEVEQILNEAMNKLQSILTTPSIIQHDESLPVFLRAYTAGNVYAHISWLGIDALQKTKQYLKANEIIETLMGQNLYLSHYRGRWHERLVINAKQHLKKSSTEVLKLIRRALEDEFLKESHRYGLTVRLEKMKEGNLRKSVANKKTRIAKKVQGRKRKRETSLSCSDSESEGSNVDNLEIDDSFGDVHLRTCLLKHEIRERTITGEKMSVMSERTGGKSVFLGTGSTFGGKTSTVSSVEYFAIEYFRKQGYIHGVHGEGSIPITIFGLLFWDIIYFDEISDIFHTPYQGFPLDIHFEEFYNNRKQLFDESINKLRSSLSLDDVFHMVDESWEKNLNKISIVNWSVFESPAQIKSLIISMGLPMVAAICERLAQNYRYFRSGFPDLVVWNESQCVFAEVKGPGDTLSAKQRLWLDFLVDIGAQAEVCHVKSVSNKRIRMVSGSDL